jgi:uncharacterized membrane protein
MVAKKVQPPKEQETSWVWYLLPILFGIIGGIIGYFLLRDKDQKTAKRIFWLPFIILGAILIFIGLLAYFGVLSPE